MLRRSSVVHITFRVSISRDLQGQTLSIVEARSMGDTEQTLEVLDGFPLQAIAACLDEHVTAIEIPSVIV